MIDHLFSAVLTFCLLAAGTAAVGSLLLSPEPAKQTQVRVVELQRVVIVAHRTSAASVKHPA